MNLEPLNQTVQNNAIWCDTICRTHGRPGEFLDGLWLNRAETPPFYPNAVTLTQDQTMIQMAHINELVAGGIPGEWGVKDSYCVLDLSPVGFHTVFEGDWIYRAAPRLDWTTPCQARGGPRLRKRLN